METAFEDATGTLFGGMLSQALHASARVVFIG